MTTEQMDWLDDERAGRHRESVPLPVPGVEHMAAVELHTPVAAGSLQMFVDSLPANATVKISPAMRVEGYRLEASW